MASCSGDIQLLSVNNVREVAAVHLSSFPGFFLSILGSRFLSLLYYGICTAPEGIAFVYVNDVGDPVGFVAGTSNPGGFYSRLLKKYWFNFVLASIVPVLRRPEIVGRLVRALSHPSGNPVGNHVAGLFSIGVLPELQGSGIGRVLMHAFLKEARRKGCRKVFLTTDRDGNEVVNQFYMSCGFTLERQYVTPEGRRMNEFWIDLFE